MTSSPVRGFSLLELLVVMLIMATALGLFLGYNYRQRDAVLLRTTAREAMQWLRASRAHAVLDGRENMAVYLVAEHRLRAELRGATVHLPGEVAVVLDADEDREMIPVALFYPDGSARGGQLVLRLDGRETRLRVEPVLGDVVVE